MKIKILNTQNEKEINKELEKLEKDRNIENIIPFKNKTWILHYEIDKEIESEIIKLREELEGLKEKENEY